MIVIIDNYDSFTYNLVQYFKEISHPVLVFRNDKVTINELIKLHPHLIVLSPGPGTPDDSGICRYVLQHFHEHTPILGVCLGHQIIIDFFGGNIVKGNKPMHGKVTMLRHNQQGIYKNIPTPTNVTRYHSLVASEDKFPKDLIISSRADDGMIMSVQHKQLPIFGIQFHPESILTACGYKMLSNCYRLAASWKEGEENETISPI